MGPSIAQSIRVVGQICREVVEQQVGPGPSNGFEEEITRFDAKAVLGDKW